MTTTTTAIPAQRPAPGDAAAESWALVERAQAGDRDAVGEIYTRYHDMVFRFVYSRAGTRVLAEDLTADTFARALGRIDSFTWQGRDFGAWLVTIARNLMADHFKSSRYRLEVITGDVIDTDTPVWGVKAGDAEAVVIEHAATAAIRAALDRLNADQRQVLVLRFLDGLSVDETARVMARNTGAVKSLQSRAVRAVARIAPELEAYR